MLKLKRKERVVVSATLALVLYTLSLSIANPVLSSLLASRRVSNTGTVKTIGVGVYWDYECTNAVGGIGWGTLEPGSSKSDTCYVRNEGNSPYVLSLETSNWTPSTASQYLTLSWDYGGQSINPDEVTQVTFTMSVSADIQGITDFSLDIVIVGSG